MAKNFGGPFKDSGVEFVHTGYGKNAVKVLQIKRDGKLHFIKEIEASVQLTLKSKKDYLEGDNGDIIPTDTIKNTVYAVAKLKGIQTIEDFSLEICNHFFTSFNHVTHVKVSVDEAPWRRFEKNGVQHVHAFIYSSEGVRYCEVEQERGGQPVIHSGIKDLRVLKTTQSGFEGFIKDKYTTLPEVKDRCFSTVVNCKWKYGSYKGINFDSIWNTVKENILDKFAGPYDKGEYSPSVQKTLYDIQVLNLNSVPEPFLKNFSVEYACAVTSDLCQNMVRYLVLLANYIMWTRFLESFNYYLGIYVHAEVLCGFRPCYAEHGEICCENMQEIPDRMSTYFHMIDEIEIILPNKHYFTIDLSKFGLSNNDEILLPSDAPYGNITGTVRRKTASKL